jgi:Trm5-related predicted tRNA methylase
MKRTINDLNKQELRDLVDNLYEVLHSSKDEDRDLLSEWLNIAFEDAGLERPDSNSGKGGEQ